MDYSSWFKIYRKRHPYTWRNKSRDDLRLMYESHKLHENQEQLKHKNALEAELKIAEDKRKILSSKKREKTFNSTCPHCFEHHVASIYYRKKEVTCTNCGKNFVATGGLKFKKQRRSKKKLLEDFLDNIPEGLEWLILLVAAPLLIMVLIAVISIPIRIHDLVVYTSDEREVKRAIYVLSELHGELVDNIESKNRLSLDIRKRYVEADSERDLHTILLKGDQYNHRGDRISALRASIIEKEKRLKELLNALPDDSKFKNAYDSWYDYPLFDI